MDPIAPSNRPARWRWGLGVGLLLAVVALAFWWMAWPADPAAVEVRRVLSLVRREERGERVNSGRLAFLTDLPGPLERVSKFLFGDGNARYNAPEILVKLGTNAEPALVAALEKDRSPLVRQVAAEALGEINGPLGFVALTNAATVDASDEVRGNAVDALVTLEREGAVPALLAGIARETNDPPRSQFVTALGSLGTTNHLPLLATLSTNDPLGEVRAAAITGMAELGGPAWAEFIETVLLQDKDCSVRRSAIKAVGQLNRPESVPVLTNLLAQEWKSDLLYWLGDALEALADPRAVPVVLQILAQTNSPPGTSGNARFGPYLKPLIRLVGEVGDRSAAPVLRAMIPANRTEESVQEAILEAVAKLEGTNCFELVLSFLGEPSDGSTLTSSSTSRRLPSPSGWGQAQLRTAAARALGMIGDPRAVPPLLAVLTNDPPGDLIEAVATALGQLGQTNAAPELRGLVKAQDNSVRTAATLALADLGDPAAVDLCLTLLKAPATKPAPVHPNGLPASDTEDVDRKRIVGALAVFSQPRVIEALATALRDQDVGVAEEAAWSLGHLRAAAAVPALTNALTHSEPRVQFAAAIALGQTGATNVVPALTALLRGSDPTSRLAAALGLAWLGDTNGFPILDKAGKGRGDWQRFAGLLGLIRLSTPAARSALELAAAPPSSSLQRLAQASLTEPGAKALLPMLSERNHSIRLYAVRALLMFADPTTLPALRAACHDRDAEVRDAARLAVRRLSVNAEIEPVASGGN